MPKVIRTYRIDFDLYDKFVSVCKKKNKLMTDVIIDSIKEFVLDGD